MSKSKSTKGDRLANAVDNARQMREKRGPYFIKWAYGYLRSLEYMRTTVQAQLDAALAAQDKGEV